MSGYASTWRKYSAGSNQRALAQKWGNVREMSIEIAKRLFCHWVVWYAWNVSPIKSSQEAWWWWTCQSFGSFNFWSKHHPYCRSCFCSVSSLRLRVLPFWGEYLPQLPGAPSLVSSPLSKHTAPCHVPSPPPPDFNLWNFRINTKSNFSLLSVHNKLWVKLPQRQKRLKNTICWASAPIYERRCHFLFTVTRPCCCY